MTTPQGPGSPPDPGDGRSVWGRPPAGGWGDPAVRPRADPGSGPPGWGAPPPADDPARRPTAPAWAQQPPPGGGWDPGPAGSRRIPPHLPEGWAPPRGGPPPGPWGPPAAYPPLPGPGERAPRRSRVPFAVAGAVVALLALGAVLAFVTPGFLRPTVFDQAALQDGVRRVLLEGYRYARVEDVACGAPGEQIAVRVDAAFTCTATVDGAPATVPVRVTTADGTYEVDRPR